MKRNTANEILEITEAYKDGEITLEKYWEWWEEESKYVRDPKCLTDAWLYEERTQD